MTTNELIDAEISVMGATLLEGRVPFSVSDRLEPRHFADPALRRMFTEALVMTDQGEQVDAVTLMSRMAPSTPAGQLDALRTQLIHLTEAVATSVNVDHHARLVEGYARKRSVIAAAERVIAEAKTADPFSVDGLISDAVDLMSGLATSQSRRYVRTTAAEAARELVETQTKPRHAEYQKSGVRQLIGLPTGLDQLDDIIDGWGDGHVHVLGARSGHGKTAFCVWTAMQAARRSGRPSLYISAEIKPSDVGLRQLASMSRVNSRHIESGALREQEVSRIVDGLGRLDQGAETEIVFCPGAKVTVVSREVQRVRRHQERIGGPGLGVVVVDYLQRFKPPGRRNTRQDEVRDIAFALTEVAQEFQVPIIAAAQLNRGHVSRMNKEPMESDLRESDAILHEASTVLFLYRPERDDESSDATECHLLARKTRKSGPSRCQIIYRPEHNWFADMPEASRNRQAS